MTTDRRRKWTDDNSYHKLERTVG